jgi:DNA uptake protein ComE-like DNA-binding protein
MTQKNRVTKNISLSFDLTQYLMDNPKISQKYKQEEFVVFTETNNNINKASSGLLEEIQKKGRKVIKAIRKNSVKNDWRFEIA